MALTDIQSEIIKICADLIEKYEKIPTRVDLLGKGISRDKLRNHFGNIEKLVKVTQKHYPASVLSLTKEKKKHVHADFTKEALGSIIKDNDFKDGTFFITAVSPTSHLDWSPEDVKKGIAPENAKNVFVPGFKAMNNFLKRNNAELVLLPMPSHIKALAEQPQFYDPRLKKYKDNFATEFTFNSHLKAIEAFINPQQANPITGFKRLRIHKYTDSYTQGTEIKKPKSSLIIAHSKQMMEVSPTGNSSHPRIVHSTGCITTPTYLRNRVGMIANNDHKLGGLVVEIRGDLFWLRQVQFNTKDGSFVDLGTRYYANGTVEKERAEAFKMGDTHCGHHSDIALNAIYQLWDIIKPKKIFLEDVVDSSSISHHLSNKRLSRTKLSSYFADLPTELNNVKKTLDGIKGRAPKDAEFFMTSSNHNDFIMRYLDEGRYINDCKANYELGHRMVVMSLDGKDPLQEYIDPLKTMKWTDVNEDIIIEGCQMNAHGHLGPNGSKGSKIGLELAFGNAMTAHTHTPGIYHNLFTVGHTSTERHGYNQGPSSWILCSGAVYKDSQKQLYFIIQGSAFRPRK